MKKLMMLPLCLCMVLAAAVPGYAADYTIGAPDAYNYGKATSVEVVVTADGGKMANEDVSKNAALIPPAFGSPAMNVKNTGAYLTPDLAPGDMAQGTINGGSAAVITPGSPVSAAVAADGASTITTNTAPLARTGAKYTSVTGDLYYANGSLGTLKIPALGLMVNVYQGTDSAALAKGAGHFAETSIWNGNVALAAHNRGVNNHFGKIHTLAIGDTITLATKLGTRTYAVTSVAKVSETDRAGLAASAENLLTLYTCVMNESAYRWCVVAKAV